MSDPASATLGGAGINAAGSIASSLIGGSGGGNDLGMAQMYYAVGTQNKNTADTQPYIDLGHQAVANLGNYQLMGTNDLPSYNSMVTSPLNQWESDASSGNTPALAGKIRAESDAMNARGLNYGMLGANAKADVIGRNYDTERNFELGKLQSGYTGATNEWQSKMANSLQNYNQLMSQAGLGLGSVQQVNNANMGYANMYNNAAANQTNAGLAQNAQTAQNINGGINNTLSGAATGLKAYDWWNNNQNTSNNQAATGSLWNTPVNQGASWNGVSAASSPAYSPVEFG